MVVAPGRCWCSLRFTEAAERKQEGSGFHGAWWSIGFTRRDGSSEWGRWRQVAPRTGRGADRNGFQLHVALVPQSHSEPGTLNWVQVSGHLLLGPFVLWAEPGLATRSSPVTGVAKILLGRRVQTSNWQVETLPNGFIVSHCYWYYGGLGRLIIIMNSVS